MYLIKFEKIRLILFLLFMPELCICQILSIDPRKSPFSQIPKTAFTETYYPLINSAEFNITEGNYNQAHEKYKKAFSSVQRPFSKDIYNACVVSIILKKKRSTNQLLLRLAAQKVSLSFLKKNQYVKGYIRGKERYFEEKFKFYTEEKNIWMLDTLKALFRSDQCVRIDSCAKKLNNNKKYIDYKNANALKEIIIKFGFPSEEISYNGVLPNEELFLPVIVHQNVFNKDINFEFIIQEAVSEGYLLPNTAMLICFFHFNDDILGFASTIGQSQINVSNSKEIEAINRLRLNWGVEGITKYNQKVAFNIKNTHFEFNAKRLSNEIDIK